MKKFLVNLPKEFIFLCNIKYMAKLQKISANIGVMFCFSASSEVFVGDFYNFGVEFYLL